jgi:hypothetical protein
MIAVSARVANGLFSGGHGLKATMVALSMVVTALAVGGSTPPARAADYEPDPVLKAAELASGDMLKGAHHSVADRVPVTGYVARFAMTSDYGSFDVHGVPMLQVRAKEVYALSQLADMSKTKEFASAAGRAVARPVASTANMIIHPVDTVTGIPDGVGRFFDRVKLGSQKVAEAATAPGKSGGERAADASSRVGAVTATAFGYEQERRKLAQGLGVDPYTTNEVLAKKLDDMAWVAFSGRFGVQAAMSVVVPYSMAMSAVTITNTMVYDTPQGDLINQARAAFMGIGATEAQADALMKNQQYSLSTLTTLAMALQQLKGVAGLPSVVDFAAIAQTQDETRLVATAMSMLARHHSTQEALKEVSAPGPIIARTARGTLLVPAPVDYVAWVERTDRFTQRDDLKAPERVVLLSGKLSPRARQEMESRKWKVIEGYPLGAAR